MAKSILIGLDGTTSSARAVQLGVQWAHQCDALLVGLVVVDEAHLRAPEAVPLGAGSYKHHRDDSVVTRARCEVEQYLEHFALKCADARVACKLLEDTGLPQDEIVREAQRYDMIMLGHRFRFQFATDYEEYHSLRIVLQTSPRPVVVVPDEPSQGKNIIVAYDGSSHAARTLQAFLTADLPGFEQIHIICVGGDRLEAGRRGDRAVEFLRSHDRAAQLHAIESTAAPATVLMSQAEALNAGLIVMGAYGQSILKELTFGSTTRTLLKGSPVPLFLFH